MKSLILRHVAASKAWWNKFATQTEMYYNWYHWRAAGPKFTHIAATQKRVTKHVYIR